MSAKPLPAPPPPAVFVGRDAELARLAVGIERVSVALIYGVAGVGKSSLASAFASTWTGPVAYCRLGSESTIAILCEDLLRQLEAAGSTLSAEPLVAAASKLDDRVALWILDDLHRLPVEDQTRLVRELGQLLRTGRVIATSRQLLPFETDGPDRLEIRLGGLDATSAQTLWTSLDELHGATPGFDSMWSKARGNPLLLRQAHACRPLTEDHITTAVRALHHGERRVATALALCELPLPTRVVHSLVPDGHTQLASLVSRMIVDPAGPGLWQLHDLFREALVANLDASLAHAFHGELAQLLADAEVDPVLRAREVTRHLRAIGDDEGCARYLLAQEPTLLKEGATAELLRGLDAIAVERRAPFVTVTIARTRARMLELERSYRELERLVARPESAIPEAWLVLGQVALLRGEMQAAAAALDKAEQHEVPSFLRQLIQITAAIVDTHRGAGDAGHRRLLEAERLAADSDEVGVLVLMRCFLAWVEERDDQLEALLRPNEWFTGCVAALRANVVAPGIAAALCARLGRFDEAEAHFAQASAALRRDEDLLSRVTLAFARASIDFERGERVTAATQLEELARVSEARGHVMGALVCNALLARALVIMGRRTAAHQILEAIEARTSQLGIVSIGRQATRARDEDVVRQLVSGIKHPAVRGARGATARARALEAVRSAATGDEANARRLVEENAVLVTGPGFGIERALSQIVNAILARLDGRERDATQALGRATSALVEDGADPALIADMLEAIGHVRAIQPHSRQLLPAARATELTASVIADARTAEIRSRDGVISLRKRPLIGKLFFGLASKPGAVWTKDALVELLWRTSYKPQVHDNPLKVSVTRLRSLIGDQMSVDFDGDGYRLAVPEQFLYLDEPTSNPE